MQPQARMKFYLLTIIFMMFSLSVMGSKLDWSIKQEIGKQTIWKYNRNQTVRATSQILLGKSELAQVNDKKNLSSN